MFTITPAAPADAAIARTALSLAPLVKLDTPTRLELVDYWEQACADPAGIGPARCGTLAATLSDKPMRDVVLMIAIGAAPDVVREIATGTTGIASGEVTAAMISDETGVEPGEQAQQVIDVLARIIGHLSHGPSYGILGMLAWWQDSPNQATAALIVAEALDPTYVITQLMLSTMRRGMGPGWKVRLAATFEDIVSDLADEL